MTHGKLQPANTNNLLFLMTVSTVWWHTSQDRPAFGSIFPTPCGTRSWRSLFLVHDFILTSYASLHDIMAKQREEHKLLQIAPSLLKEVVNAFENFNKIFDQLETSLHPTLQIVIPKYYLVVSNLSATENLESMAARFLRGKIVCGTNEKYWTSITHMPKIACFLDQSSNLSLSSSTSPGYCVYWKVKPVLPTPTTKINLQNEFAGLPKIMMIFSQLSEVCQKIFLQWNAAASWRLIRNLNLHAT